MFYQYTVVVVDREGVNLVKGLGLVEIRQQGVKVNVHA